MSGRDRMIRPSGASTEPTASVRARYASGRRLEACLRTARDAGFDVGRIDLSPDGTIRLYDARAETSPAPEPDPAADAYARRKARRGED